MKRRRAWLVVPRGRLLLLAILLAVIHGGAGAAGANADASGPSGVPAVDGAVGIPWTGSPGVTETVDEIMARERAMPRLPGSPREARPLLRHPEEQQEDPFAPPVSSWPPARQGETGPPTPERGTRVPEPAPYNPQTVGTSFLGMTLGDSGFVPPDSMGAVGPTQIVAVTNGVIRVFDKSGVVGGLNTTLNNFFASVRGSTTSDPHVRYDRLSGRWFVVAIDVLSTSNNVLLAVSSGPTLTDGSSFTFFKFVGAAGNFTDYPTLGVDRFALYIGANIFANSTGGFVNANAYVVRKSDLLTMTPTLTVTAFVGLIDFGALTGNPTPQGVDNDDPAAAEGYFIGVDLFVSGKVDLRRISDPGGTPVMSAQLQVSVPSTAGPIPQPQPAPGPTLDALDDRLFAAAIHRNKITGTSTLWTAHNIQVDASGVASGTGGRNGSRWYELGSLTGTPALVQAGTLFDPAGAAPFGYWIPSVAMSGQGHMALGASRAGTNPVSGFASVAVAGRLRADTLGTTQAPTLAQGSTFLYDTFVVGRERWGDYSQVVVDPTDDMTMWTFQEYANALNSWGVRVIKLVAPPPATPVSATPSTIVPGLSSVLVTITGSSIAGSEFFDPGPDAGGPGFPNRLAAAVSGGVIVNSVSFSSPTQAVLDLSTLSTTTGAADVTITNPDGQTRTGMGLITVGGPPAPPFISDIPDQTTTVNVPAGPIPFTVGDPDTPLDSLLLSGSSSNQALVPDGNIVFGGSGASRTVTVTPAANMVGSATITVTVSDGTLTASDTFLVTVIATTPLALAVDSAGNGVLEPGESVTVAPTWQNVSGVPLALQGTITGLTGPPGATYTILDATADYGVVADGASASCASTGNCYVVSVSVPAVRPVRHWDLTVQEASTGGTKTWVLHVGDSFADVPRLHVFYRFVETVLHAGVTAGCTASTYCPDGSTTRGQMAVFLLKSKEGSGFTPPACTSATFGDVPCTHPFADWIYELVNRGITAGCGSGLYCPDAPVTRGQMAVLLLNADGDTPPACTTATFSDVPCTHPFADWIYRLVQRGVTAGCGGGRYCPDDPVTRGQMAVFLTRTFGLVLYGP